MSLISIVGSQLGPRNIRKAWPKLAKALLHTLLTAVEPFKLKSEIENAWAH